ncbi:MAG: winged helix-turn-helix domain-containing protein [Candidatus Methanoperedens sp.]|nr:winged helix-turn-helix domain-containing protein [Candidatus Methanoperedens sp.]
MPDNEKDGNEKLLILPLGEESKKITQVISNDTARQIIELLADAPLSASDIAERLQAPLTTVTYNLENLDSVGLIKVEKIKYSEKGREIKIYAPVRKLIVVVPEKTDRKSVVDMLRKYMGIILAAVLASSLIEFFMRSAERSAKMFTSNLMPAPTPEAISNVSQVPAEVQSMPAATSIPTVPEPTSAGVYANATAMPVSSIADTGVASQAAPGIFTNLANTISAHPGLLFLMGCLFVIALLIIMDYRRKRKNG